MLKLPSEPYLSPYIRYGISTSLFFILASLFLIAAFWAKLPPQVPLFYSHPWGESQLVSPIGLILLLLLSLLIFILNFVLKILWVQFLMCHMEREQFLWFVFVIFL